jgi:hypothetical protein
MTTSRERIENLVMRMQGDFLERPGLALTLGDAERRFGIDEVTCNALLTVLADAKVLTRNREGAYVRLFPRVAGRRAPGRPFRTLLQPAPPLARASRLSKHAA